MSYHYKKDHDSCCEDFGSDDPFADLAAASSFLDTPSPEATPEPDGATFIPPAVPLVFAATDQLAFAPDPEMQISTHFKLKDLCVTGLPYPNLPDTQSDLDNLVKMGTLLDAILDNVGSFNIASVYRSQANQDYLRKSNSMAVKKSYHSLGLAADITPTNGMSPTQFAQSLYQNPLTHALLGQIVDKSEGGGQTSLHISLQTSKFPQATPMYVGSGDQYFRMTADQIGKWLSSQMMESTFTPDPSQAVSDEEMNDDSFQMPWGIVAGGIAAAAAFFFYKKRKA